MRHDYCVVGGGIVGLATAYELLRQRPGCSLVLLEKEPSLAAHQTGHNSGVIHAGVYYAPGSLKARLCRAGNTETRQFCAEHGIAVEICGKLIVATTPVEVQRLDELRERCRLNAIATEDVRGADLAALEPRITGLAALRVPSTGIVDYKRVSAALGDEIVRRGGTIRTGSRVCTMVESSEQVDIALADGEVIQATRLIACAGLQSDRLARAAGVRTALRIIPFRGEYFRLPPEKSQIVRHLIYPVPDPSLPFLGVHLTRMIGGYVTVGPNAVLGFAREGYRNFSFDLRDTVETLRFPGTWRVLRRHWRSALDELQGSASRRRYLAACRKYCPALELSDLQPYPAGIRAQAVLPDGTLVHDFMFADTPRMVHVLNAPSPAATAALPIARTIVARALGQPPL
ncbi:MAG TPA: L-2-hydroxyglutarate oxidase [Steroidobacteraceae bacterium]|nr:L-2-hydroxyglutarate oxidase [Steroidobacteraceae bacterium]